MIEIHPRKIKTDPLTTSGTDPSERRRDDRDVAGAKLSTGVGSVGGEDAGTGRGGGGGAVAQIGLGDEADCRGVGVQPEYGEALSGGGRLAGDARAAPQAASRRARGVAGGALSPASRQLRCGAPGPVARARGHGVAADGGAGGSATAPGAASRGAGLPAV